MRPCLTSFLIAAALLVSSALCAQETPVEVDHDAGVLARLSYDNIPGEHICLAISFDGDYRIARSINSVDNGEPLRLQGKIPKEQLQQLKALLVSTEFQSLSGDHGGLIRKESESFGAEIVPLRGQHEDKSATHRLHWLNADGENPFPDSVAKVVRWLKEFEPKGGKSFEYAEFPDVCPSGGLRLLQPSVPQSLHP